MNDPRTLVRHARAAATLAVLGALAAALAGCQEHFQGSCDWRPAGNNRCFDYTTGYKEAKDICDGRRAWSPKPCDLTGAIGGCQTNASTTKWLWPDAKIKTKADAQKMECTSDWLDPVRK
jgi:hypothetical protein